METTTVTARGIVCGGCANAVRAAVSAVPGVATVEVAVPEKRVTVTHDGRVSKAVIEETLMKAGFQPA
ncbi:heavy-metal-associated domain-containing protein [bacterium]|nr:heavy-metal-associated domain-containing protein [bacterium]